MTATTHETTREELAAIAKRLGLGLADVQHVPARQETEMEKAERKRNGNRFPSMDCDPNAGRVSFSMFRRGPDGDPETRGGPHSGTYSAGSGIVERWAKENPREIARLRITEKDLALLRTLPAYARSLQGAAYLADIASMWRPDIVDVFASMLSDVSGWSGPGLTFREWLDEGIAEGMNAADALDMFEAIAKEYRFLARIMDQTTLQRACELAGDL